MMPTMQPPTRIQGTMLGSAMPPELAELVTRGEGTASTFVSHAAASSVGALAAGALVGYLASGHLDGAVNGALFTSGLSLLLDGSRNVRLFPFAGAGLVALGVAAAGMAVYTRVRS